MVLSEYLAERKGIVFQARDLDCPDCSKPLRFDLVYLVREEACPEFAQLLEADQLEKQVCNHCGSELNFRSPLIYEIAKRNLLVFVTHGEDDGGLISGFKTWLGYVGMLVPEEQFLSLQKRPYCCVYGWQGLKTLLAAFANVDLPAPSSPYPHDTVSRISFGTIKGYSYGLVQFYYAGHQAVYEIMQVLLEFSAVNGEGPNGQWMLGIFKYCLSMLGEKHPWLVLEAGRLALNCKRYDDAHHYLSVAVQLQHSWLGISRSFLDATPKNHFLEKNQSLEINGPPTSPPEGDVTRMRHEVMYLEPPTSDYGLWYFPKTEKMHVPETYNLHNIFIACAYLLGRFEEVVYENTHAATDDAFFSYNGLIKLVNEHFRHFKEINFEFFWNTYLSSRWEDDKTPSEMLTHFKRVSKGLTEFIKAHTPATGLMKTLKAPEGQIEFKEIEMLTNFKRVSKGLTEFIKAHTPATGLMKTLKAPEGQIEFWDRAIQHLEAKLIV